jgi:aryl-alcohol dehydrogenase-like predicted oxidoreductase
MLAALTTPGGATSMNKRRLGNTGIETGPLIFGGNVFGWTADEKTSFDLLDAFVDAGFNVIDTADIYSMWIPGNQGGESETVIGNWLRRSGRRDQVIIATKVGVDMAVKEMPGKVNLGKEYILEEVEESLKRLNTDYIDLYQAHRDDESTPLEETLEAFDQLVDEGKVRAIGASNYSAPRLAEALRISDDNDYPRYETLQPCYNLYDRQGFEGELQQLCIDEDIGVITYFSLGSGFLTGKYRTEKDLEDRPRAYRVREMMNERGMRILAALDEVADETGATQAQVALAWLMAQPGVTAPIASATSLDQLQQLIGATQLQLDAAALERLSRAGA